MLSCHSYTIPCLDLSPPPPRGGGGVTAICMHIGYVPRERPPFSALNFRSGAYHFHKLPKNPFRSITILHFWADFAVPETIIFKISLISTRSSPPTAGRLSPNALRSAAPRVSGRSGDSHFHAQNGSSSFRSPAFSLSQRLKFVPEPRIFKLKTARARSGAPHFHARPGARSGALAHFSLCRGTYLPKFGVSNPPPPPPDLYLSSHLQSFLFRCAHSLHPHLNRKE